jgi:hypothetical protein
MWESRKKPNDMQPSQMLRACAVAQPLVALLLVALSLASVARADEPCSSECPARALVEWPRWPLASLASAVRAEEPENTADEATVELPSGEPLDLSTPEPDGSKLKAVDPLKPSAPTWQSPAWQSKVGIDYRKPAIPAVEFQPEQLVAGAIPDQSTGVAWANVNAPGLDMPLGWDKTVIETRLDPSQEQGKLGTILSRSVPVGENFAVTLQNGVSVTRTLPSPAQPPSQIWASSQALQLNLLPTDTSVSLGTSVSSTDDKWLRSLSAEQKLFGGPFSVTGSVSETASGELSKSLKAGFKRTW